MKSSTVSARLPSIATEPVSQLAQTLQRDQEQGHRDAGERGPHGQRGAIGCHGDVRGRGDGHGRDDGERRSWVKQPFGPAVCHRARTGGAHAAGAAGRSRTPFARALRESRSSAAGAARPGLRSAFSLPRSGLRMSRVCRAGAIGRKPMRRAGNPGCGWRNRHRLHAPRLPRPSLRSEPGGAATSSGTAGRLADWPPAPCPSGCRRWCRR